MLGEYLTRALRRWRLSRRLGFRRRGGQGYCWLTLLREWTESAGATMQLMMARKDVVTRGKESILFLMCYRWHSCAGAFLVWVLFLVWCFGDFKPGKLYPVAVLEVFPQH